jgi:pantoate kinase
MTSVRDAEAVFGRSFAPGHVTGIFAPRTGARDPRARGSVGAGLVLELGVHAEARWAADGVDRVSVRGRRPGPFPISEDAARRVKGDRVGTLTVDLVHELPIGQGFGMSAAGALATATAVARAVGADLSKAHETAHLADLFGGGGLGGVAAILGGGLEIRERAGVPPWGEVRRISFPRRLFVAVAGRPLPSPSLLRDPKFLARVESAAAEGLRSLNDHPTPSRFLRESEQFTDRLALAPPALRSAIDELRRTGASVGQAMFGRALFASPDGAEGRVRLIAALTRAGLPSLELRVPDAVSETL